MSKLNHKMRAQWAAGMRQAKHHDPLALTGARPRWQYVREPWDDHGELWCRDGEYVAYTSHVYDQPSADALESFCAPLGLTYEIRPPAESWYYPGQSWLVVLWAAGTR